MLGISLAGCQQPASPDASDSTATGASTEVVEQEIVIGMNAGLVPQFERYAQEFMDTHEGYTITVKPVPDLSEEYIQQLTTEALSKTLPDIVWENDTLNPTLAGNNLLFDVKPWLEEGKDGLKAENFQENFLGQYVIDDQITGIPVSADVGLIIYNKTLFDRYGVELPEFGWTYEDMYDKARRITEASNGEVYGLRTPIGIGRQYFTFYPVLKAFGTEVYDPAKNEFVFATEEGIEAWTLLLQPYIEGWGSPFSIADNNTLFQSGQAAMHVISTAQVAQMRDTVTDEWEVVPMPSINGIQATGGGSYSLSITNAANNKEGAWDFMSWFYSVDGGMTASAADGVVPPTEDGMTDGAWLDPENFMSDNFIQMVQESVPNAILPPGIPTDVQPKVVPELQTALQSVLLNGTSIEQAYGEAQATLNALL